MKGMEPDELDADPARLSRSNLAGANAQRYKKLSNERPSVELRSPNGGCEVSVGSNITPRMEVLLRKEQKLQQEESHYTYRPSLATSARKPNRRDLASGSADGGVNRFDRLYSDALKRHLEGKWKESTDSSELTFTPKISAKVARSMSRPQSRNQSRERGSMRSSPNHENTFSRLYEAPTGRVRTPVEEPTFKPSISRRAKSIDPKESAKRLYAPDLEKERRDKIRQDIEDKEFESYTFSPEVNSKSTRLLSRKASKQNLMERMEQYEQAKTNKRLAKQREKELQDMDGVTFQPALVTKSRSTTPNRAASRRSQGARAQQQQQQPENDQPFHERLAQPIERVTSDLEKEAHAEHTFHPRLLTAKRAASPNPMRGAGQRKSSNPNNGEGPEGDGADESESRPVEEIPYYQHQDQYSSVYERLFVEGQRRLKNAELQRKMTKEELESCFTFSPAINKHSRVVADSANEGEPVFERLATANSRQYMQEVLQKVKADLELRDCTFKPQLIAQQPQSSASGKSPDRSRPFFERLNSEGNHLKERHRRASMEHEQEELAALSFAPHIPEASQQMAQERSGTNSLASSFHGSVSVASARSDVHSRLHMEQIHHSPEFRPEGVELRKSLVRTESQAQRVADRLSKSQTHHLSAESLDEKSKNNNRRLSTKQGSAHSMAVSDLSMRSAKQAQATADRLSKTPIHHVPDEVANPPENDGTPTVPSKSVVKVSSKKKPAAAAATSASPNKTAPAAPVSASASKAGSKTASPSTASGKKTPAAKPTTKSLAAGTKPNGANKTSGGKSSGASKSGGGKSMASKSADTTEKLIPPSTLHEVYDKQQLKKAGSANSLKAKTAPSVLENFDFIDNPSHGGTPAASRQASFVADPAIMAAAEAASAPSPAAQQSSVEDYTESKPASAASASADETVLPSPPPAATSQRGNRSAGEAAAVNPPPPPYEAAAPAPADDGDDVLGSNESLNHVPTSSSYHSIPTADDTNIATAGGSSKSGGRRPPPPARLAKTSSAFITKAPSSKAYNSAPAAVSPSVSPEPGDEFLAKIESTMNMLKMDPASVVAAQREAEAEEAEQVQAGSISPTGEGGPDEFLSKIESTMNMLKMDPASVVAAQREAEAEEDA